MGLENSLADALPSRPEARSGRAGAPAIADDPLQVGLEGAATVIQLGEVLMILDLHRQGLSISAVAPPAR